MILPINVESDIFRLPKYFEKLASLSNRSVTIQSLCSVFAQAFTQKQWIQISQTHKGKTKPKTKRAGRKVMLSDHIIKLRIVKLCRQIGTFDFYVLATRESASDIKYSVIQAFLPEHDDDDTDTDDDE